MQQQITVSAYDMEVTQKSFISTLKWLEYYIENSGYSGNWQKQIHEPIGRKDLNNQPDEIKGFMETALLALDGMVENKPDSILENLRQQFYSWLDKSGIGVDNCPKELIECLVNIHKVLTNDGKEFAERVDREADEDIAKMTPEERRQNFNHAFTVTQRLMEAARAREKSLEGKTYKDVETKNQFTGSHEQGKKLFGQIKSQCSANSGNVDFDKVVEDFRNNPQYWRLDEIPTELDYIGEIKKKEWLLIRWDARENDFDPQTGKFNFNNNPIYRWENFNSQQRFEIKQAKGITGEYLNDEEIRWIVREVKENPRVWKVGEIDKKIYLIHGSAQIERNEVGTLIHSQQKFSETEWAEINGAFKRAMVIDEIKQNAKLERGLVVLNRETSEISESEDWYIHNQLKREFDSETKCLIYVPNLMIRAKDLTEAEQKELGYKSEATLHQTQSDNNRRGSGKGGSFGKNPLLWGSGVVISLIGLAFTKK